jgi:hypothetical protein
MLGIDKEDSIRVFGIVVLADNDCSVLCSAEAKNDSA